MDVEDYIGLSEMFYNGPKSVRWEWKFVIEQQRNNNY